MDQRLRVIKKNPNLGAPYGKKGILGALGAWEAVARYGRWFVVLEDGDLGSRERQGPFSEAEAVAVRDALNGVARWEGG